MSAHSSIDRNSIVAQSAGQLSCELDGEVVSMSLDGGKYYKIDPVGAAAWALMAKPIRVAELCASLREQFDVEQERCEADVIAFLGDLRQKGLIDAPDAVESR